MTLLVIGGFVYLWCLATYGYGPVGLIGEILKQRRKYLAGKLEGRDSGDGE